MCGIVGFLGFSSASGGDNAGALNRMTASIATRGPDDEGHWVDRVHQVGLGHRRLSIVDLSPAGHQPMMSHGGRYVVVFNGEIYNHLDLRASLDNAGSYVVWRGHSDTETLLAGFERWGIAATLEKAVGMFAFAIWDRELSQLTLARDRIGEKPLYYGWQGRGKTSVFLFGSELKALRAHPSFENVIDRGALALQLRYNCIPAPYSVYQGIAKLQPGTILTVSLTEREPKLSAYWSIIDKARAGIQNRFDGGSDAAVEHLDLLLSKAVGRQMMADVPLGAFLSGGIDSSTIVGLMQAQSKVPVKTFSIGFTDAVFNEAVHARAVATYLGTDHTELYVSAKEALDVIPRIPQLYDEPFSDSSQIPTFLVSQLARKHVTVALSGDGGDELFGGYNRYQFAKQAWNKLARVPGPLRHAVAKGTAAISPRVWEYVGRSARKAFPRQAGFSDFAGKVRKVSRVLGSASADDLYFTLCTHWDRPASVIVGALEPQTIRDLAKRLPENASEVQRMMLLDALTYLPDDVLVKVDRAAMGVSLETRVPFLDHEVIEFALSLPESMKLRDGKTKWILRQVLYRYVPRELIERPKMGFGAPVGNWLRGPLRDWAGALLDKTRLKNEGFFDPEIIDRKWQEHCAGRRDWADDLWDVLMFQLWFEQQ